MTALVRTSPPRMPNIARLLAAQISYQARLLAGGRTITIGVGLPVILLIASHGQLPQSDDATLIAGYAAFGLTITAWNTYGVRLVAAREAGVLKRWRATPLPHWCYFVGRILATVVVAVAAGAATVAAGVFLCGTHVTFSGALAALVAFILGACAWAAVATAVTALIPTLEAAAPTLMLIYFPVIIVSGTFGPLSEPSWLSTVASYLPAQPLISALGSSLSDTAGHLFLPGRDLIVLAAWAVAGLAVALATFRWEPHRPSQHRPARTAHPTNLDERSHKQGDGGHDDTPTGVLSTLSGD